MNRTLTASLDSLAQCLPKCVPRKIYNNFNNFFSKSLASFSRKKLLPTHGVYTRIFYVDKAMLFYYYYNKNLFIFIHTEVYIILLRFLFGVSQIRLAQCDIWWKSLADTALAHGRCISALSLMYRYYHAPLRGLPITSKLRTES